MCYAIPGKVTEIRDKIVTVDYFGEKRKARNDFFELKTGEYVYAQGGFVVQRLEPGEAKEVIQTWQELFLKLKQTDDDLSQGKNDLTQLANSLRHKHCGNSCCVHGIIEFSNYCRNDCLYCGIRCGNFSVNRYRMTSEEIIEAADFAVNELKFKALVLQSGEDTWYTQAKLTRIIRSIISKNPALLILSIGERDIKLYKKLYQAGARAVLLRFETSNKELYRKMRPKHVLAKRVELIRKLHKLGYLVMTGFIIGLPGQTNKDLVNDIKLANSLNADMLSCGPFIPHQDTPLSMCNSPSLRQSLSTISRMRIMNPEAKILVTSALESLDHGEGLKLGLLAGGNSLMINVTPRKYQELYDIYPGHSATNTSVTERIDSVTKLLYSIGRAPIDLGL